jgi:putative Ig domain-containing protein/Big-like domain-containing protein
MTRSKPFPAAFAFLALVSLSGGAVHAADDLAYVFTKSDQFGVIDLNTGAFTQFSGTNQQPAGMAVTGGSLYIAGLNTSALYMVNPANGSLTFVAYSSITFHDLGSTLSGLYAVDTDGKLYSINRSTAAATLIGSTGLTANATLGMSTNANSLYYTVNGNLYLLNTVTAQATLIGPTGVNGFGSMVYEDGLLYAAATQPTSQIYTLNTSTGVGTLVSTPSGTPAPGNLWGMAPASPPAGTLKLATTGSGLCGNDLINWNQLPPPVATVPTPVSVITNNGVHAALTANGGSVFSDEQASGFWNGNFGPGDFLVGSNAPIQITFPEPVWGVGAQMGYGANGAFLAGISVFGEGNAPLGSYDVSGTESDSGNNSAPFIGVLDSAGGISSVEFFTLSSFGTPPGEFAINEATLNTTGSSLAASSGSPQSAVVETAFANPLTVTLTDPCGTPLSGVTVTFAAPASGASATLSAGSAVTGANGTAAVTATANATRGSYVVTATVYSLSATFSLTNTPRPPLTITTTSPLPAGYMASPYQLTLAASGGTPPYSKWAVASGTLPPGLKLDPSSGLIHGTPTTTSGSPFTFGVTVGDSAGGRSAPAAFSLTINPPVTLESVKLPHTTVVGGKSTTDNQAILTGPAPQGGAVITLTSSDPSVASVPASVTARAGASYSQIFNIVTTAVATQTPVTISATYGGVTETATLTVKP